MDRIRLKVLAGTLAAGLLGTFALGSAGPASAVDERRGDPTITMERDGDELFFTGPEFVARGNTLTIVNNTNPQQIGPHTFTIVDADLRPNSQSEAKDCFKGKPGNICTRIFKAHDVNLQKETVGKKVVEKGKPGWDKRFRKQGDGKGDSWFALSEGAEHTRVVSARPGKTLAYFCVIHPEMQGEITVGRPVR